MRNNSYSQSTVNPATHIVQYSVYANKYDKYPATKRGTLLELVGQDHVIRENKESDVGIYSVGIIEQRKNRCKKNVQGVEVLLVDIDGVNSELFEDALRRMHFLAYVTHSTFRHGLIRGQVRARIVFPLSRVASGSEYEAVAKTIIGDLESIGVSVDYGSSDPQHLFYQATVYAGRISDKFYMTNIGLPIDVDWAIARNAHSAKRHKYYVSQIYEGNSRSVADICDKCLVYGDLFLRLGQGIDLNNRERVRAGQLLKALDVPLDQAIQYFSRLSNFRPRITESNLKSLKGFPPSCRSLARDLGRCDGNCLNRQRLRRESPLFFARDLKFKTKLEE